LNGERSPVASLVSSKPKYQLTFDTLFVDFGKIRRGEKREYTYRFQNTGTDPVVIDIVTSCDCTTLTWPEAEVIKPGARNQIHAVFDSTEKEQSETVDIDVILQQKNEKGHPILYILQYKFELE
jgi:hypothetical protein